VSSPRRSRRDLRSRVREFVAPETALVLAGLVCAELFLVVGYLDASNTGVAAWRYVAYPFVWINVGVLATWRTRPAPASDRRHLVAAAIAVGYFLLLASVSGVIGTGTERAFGLAVRFTATPGYAPTLLFDNGLVRFVVFPYETIGYLSLAYLVYATVLEAYGSAITGVVGLFSCVSCTWPVVASIVTSLLGGGIATLVTTYSLDISTVVFVAAVALLYWRPGFGD